MGRSSNAGGQGLHVSGWGLYGRQAGAVMVQNPFFSRNGEKTLKIAFWSFRVTLRQTDRQTYRPRDTPSYRVARQRLKTCNFCQLLILSRKNSSTYGWRHVSPSCAQELTSCDIRLSSLSFSGKIWENFKDGRVDAFFFLALYIKYLINFKLMAFPNGLMHRDKIALRL